MSSRAGKRFAAIDTLMTVQADSGTGGLEDTASLRRFVVCGDNPLAYRLVEELVTRYDAQVTVIMSPSRSPWAPKISALPGVQTVVAERRDDEAFRAAGIEQAAALALVDQDDAGNVDEALLAQEINPDLRLVVRMSNRGLGERIAQLLDNCVVISASAIAAPAFVASALDDRTSPPITIGDQVFVATPRTSVRPEDVVFALAITAGREEPETLPGPPDDATADLVLAKAKPPPPPRPPRRQRRIRVISLIVGARLRLALLSLLLIFIVGTVLLALFSHRGLADAAFTALISELGGANPDPNINGLERTTLAILTFVSVIVIPVLTAAVVDAVVKARLRVEAGGLAEPISGHAVVVGLGQVGTRVIRALNEAGLDIVAIERDDNARGIQVARELGIPVIIGDASRAETLQAASVKTARTLVIVSTDDVSNLETALLARAERPDLRVVVRLFDAEFAARVQHAFGITASRSVSSLAAPAFAAAMLGRQILATIPVRRRVLLVAELPIGADSAMEGLPVSAITEPHQAHLLGVRTMHSPKLLWAPPPGRPLTRTDSIVVVATRNGLSDLLTRAAPSPAPGSALTRLLGLNQVHPWQAESMTEGRTQTPPLGPEDAGSTRPA
jgi:Trk K+ transport system NAD-binding subunit